ncbi:phosphohistidine phosphatase SixA [Halomonas llamarensis]|uniref:Phosphohistidine phosphatase SixA n=1 Tax=Halomonas llamarensis TaxID=2945104 RepID=A0ABT0SMA9_9GAMM|nr:phosphohistidine phosphatase SixA [Halomonas llamarensis]MCL7928928.1 phosphohistidine phosphatase SixA [Halomonas llamarensis]
MASSLFIMRHGEASPGSPDSARRLTSQGEQEATIMASWLASRQNRGQLGALKVVASPFARAQQTASTVAKALDVSVETYPGIAPEDSPQAVCDWLVEQEGDILLVSHMPLVAALAGLLVEGRTDRGVGFPTAAIAELEADVWAGGCARLTRFTEPRQVVG